MIIAHQQLIAHPFTLPHNYPALTRHTRLFEGNQIPYPPATTGFLYSSLILLTIALYFS